MRSTIAILAVLALQTPTQEVRIRSAVYTPQPPTISVQTNLVELGATIRDNHGKFASGLQASDFEVLDKGDAGLAAGSVVSYRLFSGERA